MWDIFVISEYILHVYMKSPSSTPIITTKAPDFCLYSQKRWNYHYKMYWFWFLPFFHLCSLHHFRVTLSILFIFLFFPYYLGIINDCIIKIGSDIGWSFSITIWWTLRINKTCDLYFSSRICIFFSRIFGIIPGYNINSHTIWFVIFLNIFLSNLLFRFDTTPIIINIFCTVVIYFTCLS